MHVNLVGGELGRMVRELQEAGHGDAGRLAHVADAIARGRVIYDSDRLYVERKYAELGPAGRSDPARAAPANAQRRAARSGVDLSGVAPEGRGAAGTPASGRGAAGPPEAKRRPDIDHGLRSQAPRAAEPAPPQHDGEGRAWDGEHAAQQGGGAAAGQRRASAAWYLLPIFMSIVGGIISYAALRHRDPSRARKTLAVGAILFGMVVAVVAAAVVYDAGAGTYGSVREAASRNGMDDSEIKAVAVEVPYASLERDPDGYAGTIIRYEGHVIQAEKNPFWGTYVLRIGTSTGGIGPPEEDIWSEYEPRNGAERQWLDGLDREGLIIQGMDSGVVAWGEVVGSQEYDTLFGGKRTIPAVNVLILEKAGG